MKLPSYKDVKAASERIKPAAINTPLLHSDFLDEACGARVLVKPECLQRTGSFKIRGAYNRLCQLSLEQKKAGVVAFSSGNHAQGVAYAAKLLNIPATIVMPSDAPEIKIANTKSYKAEVVTYDRFTESREDIAAQIARERNAVVVPSYDDFDIISGQGTVGLEIVEQVSQLGLKLDCLLVCCGGGGLIAGSSLAVRELSPDTDIYAVEPDDFDDHKRSLEVAKRLQNRADARSICDALLAPTPGKLTFEINCKNLSGAVSVSDEEVKSAMFFASSRLKLVLEPGGAVALAAVLSKKLDLQGKTVAIVLSGGNVDMTDYISYLSDAAASNVKT